MSDDGDLWFVVFCFVLFICVIWMADDHLAEVSQKETDKQITELKERLKESRKQADYKFEFCRKQLGHRSDQ